MQNSKINYKKFADNYQPKHQGLDLRSSSQSRLKSLSIIFSVLLLVGCGGGGQNALDESSDGDIKTVNTDEANIVQQGFDISNAITGETVISQPEIGAAQSGNGAGSNFTVENISVDTITAQSARITWRISDFGTGQVLYGPTQSLGLSSVREERFEYSEHIQTISGLQPNTLYHFQVVSTSQSGTTASSNLQSFRTLASDINVSASQPEESAPVVTTVLTSQATPEPAEGWPSNYDNNVPLGNIFYGQYQVGFHTGNSRIALQSARRFRAERGGFINAVSYNNRTFNNANITGRCLPSAPDSVYCKCLDAGLDQYTCGYTVSNSYSIGNGGSIVVEVRTDDNGVPSDTVLGETAIPFVPLENVSNASPILELAEPVQLVAGEIYHLVWVNKNPPSSCAYSHVAVSQAGACPKTEGAIGLNGIYLTKVVGANGGIDPFRGDSGANFHRMDTNEEWTQETDNLSWYEVRYDDGVWVGDSYAAYLATYNGTESVGGANVARQVFTVEDGTKIVDGVWLHFGHTNQGTADGSPITVKLKDSSQNVLATSTISASQECISSMASSSSRHDQHCREWGYTEFSEEIALIEGNEYSLEVSAGQNSGVVISSYFPLNYGGYTFEARGRWANAAAEISNNNGASWSAFDSNIRRNMGLLFTISGMPRALP